jgi:hypothetical protein
MASQQGFEAKGLVNLAYSRAQKNRLLSAVLGCSVTR